MEEERVESVACVAEESVDSVGVCPVVTVAELDERSDVEATVWVVRESVDCEELDTLD